MLSNYGGIMDKVVSKPIVHYVGEPTFDTGTYPGNEIAHVWTLDHYKLGENLVRTSQVVNKFDDGCFETLNTMYKPATNGKWGKDD